MGLINDRLQIVAGIGGLWCDLQASVEAMGETLNEDIDKLTARVVLQGSGLNWGVKEEGICSLRRCILGC